MKVMNKKLLTFGVITVAASFSVLPAQAQVAGKSSNELHIQVGGTQYNHTDDETNNLGKPGIGIKSTKTPYKRVSLHAQSLGGLAFIFNQENVVSLNPAMTLGAHPQLGYFNFGRVKTGNGSDFSADDKLYFGEWSQSGNVADGTHTVYYVGSDKTSDMPTSGTAVYDVRGINNYNTGVFSSDNQLRGTLTANFASERLNGSLSNDSLTLDIRNNRIDSANASFAGAAYANGVRGNSKGEFFGDNAQALGGIATFNNNSLDTAFAGTKR